MEEKSGFKGFLTSPVGRIIVPVVLYVVIWGIIWAIYTSNTDLGAIMIIPCAVGGWKALNRIQPSMFLWMSWLGWVVYFIVKFFLSAVIGLFVTPYVLATRIINSAYADDKDGEP